VTSGDTMADGVVTDVAVAERPAAAVQAENRYASASRVRAAVDLLARECPEGAGCLLVSSPGSRAQRG
jgi:hypothetical protein